MDSKAPPEEQVDTLFWNALSRAPSPEEHTTLAKLLSQSSDKRATLEDLAWTLVNAKEFVLRR
ncbi:hypothetical protein [Verrucomicrobium spinosum]|nr:hypothetical protein [Verrucomicrobium spinosum]